MAGAYGGLLASPILATILVLEIARLKALRFADTLVASLLSSSIAFAVDLPIAGSTFVGIFALPSFKYEDWQLLAAVPLGLVAAARALILVIAVGALAKLTAPLATRTILRATIVGVIFGLVGMALPLTLFTGTDQLPTVISDGATLGAGLLIAVVFAKMLAFAVCEATGFIGGPFLVMLFIGGTAGTAAHVLIPGLPEGLAFIAIFAALPGAVLTAYLAVSGSGALGALASRARKSTSPSPKPA
jgi:H+/Cl- antiporter ClcA